MSEGSARRAKARPEPMPGARIGPQAGVLVKQCARSGILLAIERPTSRALTCMNVFKTPAQLVWVS